MTAYVSNQNGDWATAAVWTPNGLPASGDTAQCSHDITIATASATIDTLTVDSGKTLTLSGGYDLTAMTASCGGSGTIVLGAGSDLKWDASLYFGTGDVSITANGTAWTAGNFCVIENVHATGRIDWANTSASFDLSYTDVHSIRRMWCNGDWKLNQVDFEGGKPGSILGTFIIVQNSGRVQLRDIWISNLGWDTAALWLCYSRGPRLRVENLVFGYDRDGNTQQNSNADLYMGLVNAPYLGAAYLRNARFSAATHVAYRASQAPDTRVWADNYGFDGSNGTRGIWHTENHLWSVERSTTNPKSGETYHARVTPKSGMDTDYDDDKAADIDLWVPIETGDDCSVDVYGYNHNLDTGDCAEVIIDPEGSWYTTQTSEPTWTADTWVQANPSASTAGGSSEKGSVHIVLRVKDYASGSYFDWSKCTVVCGGKTYTCSHQQGQFGMPIADEPAGTAMRSYPRGVA